MGRAVNHLTKSPINFLVGISLLLTMSLGCNLMHKKPWRNYDYIPFDQQKWRDGDDIERGRMRSDLAERKIIDGKTRQQILEILGEPDEKISKNSEEIWLYDIEVVGTKPQLQFPITFDKNGKASIGMEIKK